VLQSRTLLRSRRGRVGKPLIVLNLLYGHDIVAVYHQYSPLCLSAQSQTDELALAYLKDSILD